MRTYNCSEIFKETETGLLTMKEVDAIQRVSPSYKFCEDLANGIVAFALDFKDEEKADELVDTLNEICESKGMPCDWYLGDEDEEYVFVD